MNKNIKIKTITPIHVGSGNKIETFDYFWSGNKLFVLNQDEIFNFIFSKNNEYLDDFNQWIEEKANIMSQFGHKTAKSSYKLNPIDFVSGKIRDNKLKKEIIDKFYNDELIHYVIGDAINPNSKDVSTLLKSANNEVYIPGSSLKGVVRTALLNEAIYNLENPNKVKDILSQKTRNIQDRPKKKDLVRFADEIINYLVNGDIDKNGKSHFDAKYDIFKFIKISDSLNSYTTKDVCKLVDTKLFKINGKIDPQAPVIEVILPETEFEFILDIDVEYIKSIAKSVQNETNKEKHKFVWRRFFDVMDFVFGTSKEEILNKTNEEIFNIIYEVIKSSILNFSTALFNKSKLLPNTNSEYAIKLGWASGFPATTLFDSFTNEELGMKEIYKNALEKFEIGLKGRNTNLDLDKFPISQRIELSDQKNKIPLGWVDVIM